MKSLLNFFILFTLLFSYAAKAQKNNVTNNVIYIIDDIPLNPLTEGHLGDLTEDDIHEQKTITDLSAIKKLGYSKYKSIVFITTKPYHARTEEELKIPTTRLMYYQANFAYAKKNDEVRYTGPFRDYYLNGKLRMEGSLYEGKLEGNVKSYYSSGVLQDNVFFISGLKEGPFEMYHVNGKIKEKGTYSNNGFSGLYRRFYSTGKLATELVYFDPRVERDFHPPISSVKDSISSMYIRKAMIERNADKVIRLLNSAEQKDKENTVIYYQRALAFFKKHELDSAIKDLDNVIELEPLESKALMARALIRIGKNDRNLRFEDGDFVFSDNDPVNIDAENLMKICADLTLAIEIGDVKRIAIDAYQRYCQSN